MDHREAWEILKRLKAGEKLLPQELEELLAHIQVCESCALELTEVTLHAVPRVEPPPDLRYAILRRVRAEEQRGLKWRLFPRLAPALAFLLLLAVGLYLFFGGQQEPLMATAYQIELVTPVENDVLLPDEVALVAAFYPNKDNFEVRLFLDDEEVTDLARVTPDYLLYRPERLDPGYHRVLLIARRGEEERRIERVFYVEGGESVDLE